MELKEYQVEAVESLLQSDGWAIVEEILEERIELRQAQIAAGRCETYDDYLASCKSISELRFIASEPRRLLTAVTMRSSAVRR